jgi:kojibiose phosphorylase
VLPGTFLRGVFDHHDSAVIELVKAPDWLSLALVVDGTRLDVTSASVVHHRRVLDLRQGALFRETVFEDSQGLKGAQTRTWPLSCGVATDGSVW